jgi:hypothetical protein
VPGPPLSSLRLALGRSSSLQRRAFNFCKFEHFQDPVPGFNFLTFLGNAALKKNKNVI